MKESILGYMIVLFAFFLFNGRAMAQTAEELFQKGVQLEEVKGELEKAINIFKQVVEKNSQNKPLASKSLLRLGQCYEKMGKSEAKKAYERIVREYSDQQNIANEARARLTALTKAITAQEHLAITTRQVWAGPGADVEGTVSSDGRFLSFVDWSSGDIAVRDLQLGQSRRLTHKGDWSSSAYADFSAISPDGKEIAYIWYDGKQTDLRVVGTDGSEARVIYQDDEVPWLWPRAWTPDKRCIVATFSRKDGTHQIALVSTSDRSVRVLKSFDWRTPGNLSVSPDGKWIAYSFQPVQDDKQHDIFVIATDGSQETYLVQHPANDDTPVWSPDGKAILFRSDRGGSPGFWLSRIANGRAEGNPELIKSNIDDIFPLGFTEKGAFFYGIIGPGNNVYTVDFDLKKGALTSTPKLVSQKYVGSSSVPDWSPDGNTLAFVIDQKPGFGFGGRRIAVKSLKTEKERELPRQDFDVVGMTLRWSPDGNSLLVAGRLDSVGKAPRYGLFRVDAQTGSGKFLAIRAVQTSEGHGGFGWDPGGNSIVAVRYAIPAQKYGIARTNIITGQEEEIFQFKEGQSLRFSTLSPNGTQLACWSLVKDTKSLLLIPTEGGTPREILKGKRDVTNLGTPSGIAWTPDGKQLIFGKMVSRDKTELWKISIEDGSLQKIGILSLPVHDIVVHPNGTRLAFSAIEYLAEVWVMENFLPKEEKKLK